MDFDKSSSGPTNESSVDRLPAKSLWQRILAHRGTFWGSFLVVGPFAFPLLWANPRYSRGAKIAITIICSIVTIMLLRLMVWQAQQAVEVFREYEAIQQQQP